MDIIINNGMNNKIGDGFTAPHKINEWSDHETDDIKQTHDIKQTDEKQASPQHLPYRISDDPVSEWYRDASKKPISNQSLEVLAGPNIDKKVLNKMQSFETRTGIPMRAYMWDILGLLRCKNSKKRIMSQSTDAYAKCLPCAGGIFQTYFVFGTDLNPFAKPNPQNTPSDRDQIKSLIDCAKHKHRDDLSPIVLPNEVSFKIDGIWEMDVRIFRAINENLDRLSSHNIMCQLHISIWSNGPIAQTQSKDTVDEKTENEAQSEDEIAYDCEADVNAEIRNINKKCCDLNIEDVMHWNKGKHVIKKQWPNTIKDTETKPESGFTEEVNATYDQIETFINGIMEGAARPKSGDAIMILFDTTNAPKLTAYIWRERLTEKDINIDTRIHSKSNRKRRYFELNIPSDTQQPTTVNVGQYVGMDIFLQSAEAVHQFWTIFNTETRFDPAHALNLWCDYYVHETIFEVASNLDDEYEAYSDNDTHKRRLYEASYGKRFVDRLHERSVDNILEEGRLAIERDKSLTTDGIPDLNEYKPFQFQWRRAQYVKYYGLEFIRKLHDKSATFDREELWEKRQISDSNEKSPDLTTYGPFQFHWQKEKHAENFKRDLVKTRQIKNLEPENFKRFYSDACSDGTKKTKGRESRDEYKGPM